MSSKHIIIIGGGIIGSCTAYYSSRHPSFSAGDSITVIEASVSGPATGASGKAGGLVARWAYPKPLVNVSFEEHVKLAEEHNGKERWGWRYVNCGSWEGRADESSGIKVVNGGKSLEKTVGLESKPVEQRIKDCPDWVHADLTDSYSSMAPFGHTAQVHPYQFTTSILSLAKENGVRYIQGKVTNINKTKNTVAGVTFLNPQNDEEELNATHVILCAGAWSPSLVPELPITTTRAHSITVRPDVKISPYVLFTEITLASTREVVTPEIYARPDNEIYVCSTGDDEPLPSTVDEVTVSQAACDKIYSYASSISKEIRETAVDKRQACYLPLGGPILGHATSVARGLYIATGHTCWGISNAPGTGKALSELVMEGKIKCANLKSLEPRNFF